MWQSRATLQLSQSPSLDCAAIVDRAGFTPEGTELDRKTDRLFSDLSVGQSRRRSLWNSVEFYPLESCSEFLLLDITRERIISGNVCVDEKVQVDSFLGALCLHPRRVEEFMLQGPLLYFS
uniref:Uncharacterized protein n=1 Tax=Physcomitrium patens TaxID=3218 RepID=A0A2K1JUX2_PHYPA|nr:hypothetical protein PHYPA_015092 [Physcomitrium patens]